MSGMKTFAETDPGLGPGGGLSREHPFQAFQWADYRPSPTTTTRYTVVPLYGTPRPRAGRQVSVRVHTEPELGARTRCFFNRGASRRRSTRGASMNKRRTS